MIKWEIRVLLSHYLDQGLEGAGVRDPRFRRLSRTEQEELAGTSWDVLSTVYDDLTEEDLRDAVRRLETG